MGSITRQLTILCLGGLAAAITACTSPTATQCDVTGVLCPAGSHCAAAESVCISDTQLCGNFNVDGNEECDDGNTKDGDGCSHECKKEVCGNGIMDPGEVCDLGPGKNGVCGGCAADCKSFEVCGDGVKDPACGEVCDDKNTTPGDGCSANCKSTEVCGNHIIDHDVGEVCDDGAQNGMPGDNCSINCRSNLSCNNGTVDLEKGEECDHGEFGAGNPHGNDNSQDCRADCQFNRCGDGFTDTQPGPRHEQCDGGHLSGLTPVPEEKDNCNLDCTTPSCGDGKINRHFKPDGVNVEQCDDGGANDNHADCTSTCQVNVCGDGLVDNAPGPHHEDCDDGAMNGTASSTCTKTCHMVNCGNGIVEQNEQCDDGANNGPHKRCNDSCKLNVCGDGDTLTGVEQCDGGLNGTRRDTTDCNDDCTNSVCGDGHKNTMSGETCDDGDKNGTLASPNHCDRRCHAQSCGNGLLDPGEECDPGNGPVTSDIASCNANCTVPRCGDGITNMAAGEDCDDGPDNGTTRSTHNCSVTCKTTHCGNGILEQNEECDDGDNNDDNGRCKTNCKFNVCGDGKRFTGVEECDEGLNGTPRDTATCDSDCTVPVCGDHHLNQTLVNGTPLEVCDDGVQNGTAASPNNCDLLCRHQGCGNGLLEAAPPRNEQCDPNTGIPATDSTTCTFDCKVSFCGDHHTNAMAGELCDDGVHNGDPCDYGSPTCTRCNNDCTDPNFHPGGPFCGDGVKQAGHEQCDPGGGVDSVTGLPTPVDSATCNFDCTQLTCGDGHINTVGLEVCDNFNNLGCGLCDNTCHTPVTANFASGSIITATADMGQSNIMDGDTFTLNDGFHPAITFTFHYSPSMTDVDVLVVAGDTDLQVADAVVAAIKQQHDNGDLDITADDGNGTSATVALTNSHNSSLGNITITHHGHIDTSFTFSGMAGGRAGACNIGTGCSNNADCASNNCDTVTTHKCIAAP